MKKYEFILWDIDDTLIDFKASETTAIKKCFKHYGVDISKEELNTYSEINKNYWKLLEQGKIEKHIMLVKRFEDFINYLEVKEINPKIINETFQESLGDTVVMFPYAMEICKKLQGLKKQYVVTNGTKIAQNKKLNNTGLIHIFDGIFISDEVGYQKPDIRFFKHCFKHIPNFDPDKAIIIGDSLSSDMKGAQNAGIDSCWFNPRREVAPNDLFINYEIQELESLEEYLL